MKYRKKSIVVEATRFTQASVDHYLAHGESYWLPRGVQQLRVTHPAGETHDPQFFIHTLEGDMRVNVGDWVITGVEGERYPCKDSIFRATYEEA